MIKHYSCVHMVRTYLGYNSFTKALLTCYISVYAMTGCCGYVGKSVICSIYTVDKCTVYINFVNNNGKVNEIYMLWQLLEINCYELLTVKIISVFDGHQ